MDSKESNNIHYVKNSLYKVKFMAKCEKLEFVKGHTDKNGGYDWTRLDVYFKAVDDGDPVRISAFLRGEQTRLIGLTDAECKKK